MARRYAKSVRNFSHETRCKIDSILMAKCYGESKNISLKTRIKIQPASMAIYIYILRAESQKFPLFKTRIHRLDIKMLRTGYCRIFPNLKLARVARC